MFDEYLKTIAAFIRDIGFPIAFGVWAMWFISAQVAGKLQLIVEALISIRQDIEYLRRFVEREANSDA